MNFRNYIDEKEEKEDKKKVRTVIKDWQNHKEDFFNYEYWERRFAPYKNLFEKYKPKSSVQLWRSERTDIENKYAERYSSWSEQANSIEGFGWGKRRMVTCTFEPSEILVFLSYLNLDSHGFQEVIVKPGNYKIVPWKLVWDREGFFNYYDDPTRYEKHR